MVKCSSCGLEVSDDLEKLENGKYVYTIKELKADTAYEIVIE